MADYRKMYYVLCKAIDDVIDPLEGIPLARPYAQKLQKALLEAEEIYITTTPRKRTIPRSFKSKQTNNRERPVAD